MNKYLPILIILGILFAACVPSTTTDQSTISSPAASKINVTNPTNLVQNTPKDSPQLSSPGIPTYSSLSPSQVSSDNTTLGIWVLGEGTIQLKPDLTILRIGVESKSRTVREANKNAAMLFYDKEEKIQVRLKVGCTVNHENEITKYAMGV